MQTLKLFLSTLTVCFCLDMIWLGMIAQPLYNNSIGDLLKKSNGVLAPNWLAAIMVYLAITIGVLYFALPKANSNYATGLFWGAILGFVIYGVYDFTNYAILANWPLKITLIDIVWGMILCGTITVFSVWMQRWLAA